jgi:hypothetical protein
MPRGRGGAISFNKYWHVLTIKKKEGFLRYPKTLKDLNGKDVVETGTGDGWSYGSFVDSPDPRYRKIVKHFKDAGSWNQKRMNSNERYHLHSSFVAGR